MLANQCGFTDRVEKIILNMALVKILSDDDGEPYRMRAGKKGDADADIQKARWYENYVEYLNNCKDDLTKNH